MEISESFVTAISGISMKKVIELMIGDDEYLKKKFKHQQNASQDELELAMSRTELPKTGTAVSSQKYI